MKKTGKRVLSLLLAVVLLLACVPNIALAADAKYEIGPYYEVNKNGNKVTEVDNPVKIIPGDNIESYIKISKTIPEDDVYDDEFEVTLKVETTEDLSKINLSTNANVVLVFDVSDSMDFTVGGINAGKDGWKLADTRWTALKDAAKEFIGSFLKDSNNQISIVVYGGYIADKAPYDVNVHETICGWTSSAKEAIDSFDKYRVVTETNVKYLDDGISEESLRWSIFKDDGTRFGLTNSQAGFRGAIQQLSALAENDVRSQFVVYMSDGTARGSYDDPEELRIIPSSNSAIAEAGLLIKEFPNCTIYTIGFSEDAAGSLVLDEDTNKNVTKSFHAETAGDLEIFYDTILGYLKRLSEAWTVTDPMSKYVSYVDESIKAQSGVGTYTAADSTITWNLRGAKPTTEYIDEYENTVYVYTLTYTIQLKQQNDDGTETYDWVDYNLTNKRTILTYAFSTNGQITPDDLKTDTFLVPTVRGLHNGKITKSASETEVQPGDTFEYTIKASNTGDSATVTWLNVVATDVLDGDLTYVQTTKASNGVSVSELDGTVTINFGDIDIGIEKEATIEVKVKDKDQIEFDDDTNKYMKTVSNKATAIGANINDKEKESNIVDVDVISPEGSIKKTADSSEKQPGEYITYTITAANSDRATAKWENVEATDVLDSNLIFVNENVDPSVSYDASNRKVTIKFGDIDIDEEKQVTFKVQVDPNIDLGKNIEIPINNDVKATSDNYRDVFGNVVVNAVGPGGWIDKISSEDYVERGDRYYYTITATNNGTATWENVEANDILDSDFITFDSFLSTQGVTVSNTDGDLTFYFGDIPAKSSKTVLIYVKVNDDAEIGEEIDNDVDVSGTNDLEVKPVDPANPSEPLVIDETSDPEPPVVIGPNGSISKGATKSRIIVGDSFEYTITASNKSDADNDATAEWKNVIATDTLNSNLSYDGWEIVEGDNVTVSESDGDLTINFGNIGIEKEKTVKIKVKVNLDADFELIKNIVTATSDNFKEVSDDETVYNDGPIGKIEKSSSIDEIQPGEPFTYTIKASNSKNAAKSWENVVATDVLDENLIFIDENVDPSVSYNASNRTVTINFGDIGRDEEKEVSFKVKVNPDINLGKDFEKDINNKVTATSTNFRPLEDDAVVNVVGPGGSITKTASVSEVARGERYHYTITASNNGNVTWENVVGKDDLTGKDITFDSFLTTDQGVTVSNANGVLSIDFEDIPAGESKTVLIFVRVNDNATIGDRIENEVTVKGYNDIYVDPVDPDDPDNPIKGIDPIQPLVMGPDGSISKVAKSIVDDSTINDIRVGEEYYYTITATNSDKANVTWKNVIATDELDSALTYVGSDQDPGIVSQYGGTVTVNFGDIEPGDTKTVKIYVEVKSNADVDEIYNTVTAKSNNYPDVDGKYSVNLIGPEGTIVKEASVKEIRPGNSFDYTITATNNGNEDWENVIATDTLDDRLTITGVTPDDDVTVNGQDVTINFGTITPNEAKKVTINVSVKASADLGELKNTVNATSTNYPDLSDDADVTVIGPIGSIVKYASVPDVAPGERYYYTITASNDGNKTWENVVATDTLDSKYITFDSYTSPNGATLTNDNGDLTIEFGSIEPGKSKTVLIYVRVKNAAPVGDNIPNAVIVTSSNNLNPEPITVDDPVQPLIITLVGKITKEASEDEFQVGDTFSYTITASAEGNETWESVIGTDMLDSALTYAGHGSLSNGVTVSEKGGVVTINFGNIEPGDANAKSATINVSVNSNAASRINNTVTVKSNNYRDVNDYETVDVIGPIGSITKSSNAKVVQPGETYEYTITASNDIKATAPWEDVVATDVLDSDLTLDKIVSNSPGVTVTNDNGTLTVNFGNIDEGESKEVVISVKISDTAAAGKTINNAVIVAGKYDPPNPPPVPDPDPPVVTYPDGHITKTASVTNVAPGERYYYTFTATNKGNVAWENVVGTDTLDSRYITFDSYISSDRVSVTNNNGTLTINFDKIEPNQTKTVYIFVKVKNTAQLGDNIPNAVIVSGSNDLDPGNPIKGDDPVEPLITSLKGSISKVASVEEVRIGESFSYTITASNDGSETWESVIGTDKLDDSLKYDSCDPLPSGVTVTEKGGVVTINFGDIEAEDEKTVKINVTVKSNASKENIYNSVIAKSNNYRDVDDYATVDLINPIGSIKKSSSVDEVQPGETYEYTITASNSGSATAPWEDVVATDELDSDLTFDGVVSNSTGVTVTNNSRTLTINYGSIQPDESKYVTIRVKVSDTAAVGKTINNAVIAAGKYDPPTPTPVPDPDPPVVKDVNGSISKIASADSVQTGQSFYYTISVTNPGTSANNIEWTNVIGTDVLSSDLTYVSSSSDQGVTVTNNNGTLTINFGNISVNGSKSVRINVSVKSNAAAGTLNNTVNAVSTNYKPVSASYPVTVVGADGVITKRANSEKVAQGETYTYTMTATNGSTGTWQNVVGTDRLDSSLITYVSSSSTDGVTVNNSNGSLTVNFGDIEAGTSKTVTISVSVNWGVAAGTRIPNTVTYGTKTAEDPVKPEVLGSEITATKTSNREDTTFEGDEVLYEVTVENTGKAPAYDVAVNDNIHEAVNLIEDSVKVNGVTSRYTYTNGVLSVGVGDLAVGESATVTFSVIVTADAIGESIENTGIATGYTNKNHGSSDTPDLSDNFSDNNTTEVKPSFTEDHVNYIVGYDDVPRTVRPEANITRAETVTIVFRLLTDESRNRFWSKTNNFSDVPSDKWFNNAVSTMAKAGIIDGYTDGTYRPNINISRAEFAVIMARFDSSTYTGEDKFPDIADHWAREYINRAAERGWVEGYSDGEFKPDRLINRAEAMTLVNRVLNRENIAEFHEDMVTWPDNLTTDWHYKAVQEATNTHDISRDDDGNETWTTCLPPRDWPQIEKEWSEANS